MSDYKITDNNNNKTSAVPRILNFDADLFVCLTCRKQLPKKKACSQCHTACYCDAKCQQADWKEHKSKCADLLAGFHEKQKRIKVDFNSVGIDSKRLMECFNEIKDEQFIQFEGSVSSFCYRIHHVTDLSDPEMKSFSSVLFRHSFKMKTAIFPVLVIPERIPVFYCIQLINGKMYGTRISSAFDLMDQWYIPPSGRAAEQYSRKDTKE